MKLTLPELQKAGKKLKDAREAKKQSLLGIARSVNLRHSLLQRVESGIQAPPVLVLQAYSQVCGMNLDALLLDFGYLPEDVFLALRANPALCETIRSQALKH